LPKGKTETAHDRARESIIGEEQEFDAIRQRFQQEGSQEVLKGVQKTKSAAPVAQSRSGFGSIPSGKPAIFVKDHGGQLDLILDKVDVIATRIKISNQAYGRLSDADDYSEAWKQLRRELVIEGFSSDELDGLKVIPIGQASGIHY
jgi:hypothetical protein